MVTQVIRSLPGDYPAVSVAFDPQDKGGQYFAAILSDGAVVVWDVHGGKHPVWPPKSATSGVPTKRPALKVRHCNGQGNRAADMSNVFAYVTGCAPVGCKAKIVHVCRLFEVLAYDCCLFRKKA